MLNSENGNLITLHNIALVLGMFMYKYKTTEKKTFSVHTYTRPIMVPYSMDILMKNKKQIIYAWTPLL